MAVSIPPNATVIPVNLSSTWKTFTLPVVSTNAGRMLIFKDLYGASANSTIRLSTIGLDRIERTSVSSMVLSQAFGAWTFMNDGRTNWFLTDVYKNTFTIRGTTPNILRIDYAWYGSSYKTAGANVTTTVLSIFNSGRTSFVAGNGELGDPQPGTGKSFWIDYYPPNSVTLKQAFFAGESSTVTFANLT